jgi:adenosine deaminase
MRSVLQDFEDDGVRYLELRTTPRAIPSDSISKEVYVRTILDVIRDFAQEKNNISKDGEEGRDADRQPTEPEPRVYLLLSIDRRNTCSEAIEVVDLALRYRHYRGHLAVLGIDLCGDPSVGDVSIFRDAFARARQHGLKITVHFAEVPASSSRKELETLLSFQPDRLGHVIHVPEDIRAEIASRGLGLELCMSCNILAKMIEGGFADHHFGYWREKGGHIILSVRLSRTLRGSHPFASTPSRRTSFFWIRPRGLRALTKCVSDR